MEMTSFICGIPKAELHIHLEGSIEPQLMFEMAARNHIKLHWETLAEVKKSYRFPNLEAFLQLYYEGCRVLVQEQDFYEMTLSYLRRAHEDGVIWAEMSLGMQNHTSRGIAVDTVMGGIARAIDYAAQTYGIRSSLVVIAQRHRSEKEAYHLLEQITPWSQRIVAIGMGGAEVGNPPAKFAAFFRACRKQGFCVTIHAGEEGPPSYVREAVEVLGADRIDHGVTSIHDPALVEDLARLRIPLTVCPLSNVKLKNIPTLAQHPLKRLMDAGVLVTINSDDPSYFGAYIGQNFIEYQQCFSLSSQDIIRLARNSFSAAFIDVKTKVAANSRIDSFIEPYLTGGVS